MKELSVLEPYSHQQSSHSPGLGKLRPGTKSGPPPPVSVHEVVLEQSYTHSLGYYLCCGLRLLSAIQSYAT